MPDINGMSDAMPYAWTGGAGLLMAAAGASVIGKFK